MLTGYYAGSGNFSASIPDSELMLISNDGTSSITVVAAELAQSVNAGDTLLISGDFRSLTIVASVAWRVWTSKSADSLLTLVKNAITATAASAVSYDPAVSGLTAEDVKAAIDELMELVAAKFALPADTVAGDILIRGAEGWVRLPKGTDGDVLTLVAGLPAWVAPTP